jgi:peptidyl-prolyl cis-trans isomerase B (cyclophilin B)
LTPILGFVLGVLAIIFGAVAMNQIKSRGQQGRGLALTGLILGIVVAAWAIIAAIFLGGALLFNMDG